MECTRAAVVPAETGNHLVEDDEGSAPAAHCRQRLEEARRGRRARLRFEHDSGNLPGVRVEQRFQAREIVIAE